MSAQPETFHSAAAFRASLASNSATGFSAPLAAIDFLWSTFRRVKVCIWISWNREAKWKKNSAIFQFSFIAHFGWSIFIAFFNALFDFQLSAKGNLKCKWCWLIWSGVEWDEKQAFTYGSIIVCTLQLPYEDFSQPFDICLSQESLSAVKGKRKDHFNSLIENYLQSISAHVDAFTVAVCFATWSLFEWLAVGSEMLEGSKGGRSDICGWDA